jgi:hypothetical protein
MFSRLSCQRPYHVERTWSRQLPEVKLRRVPLVLGWVTAWEYGMLLALHFVHLTVYFVLFFFQRRKRVDLTETTVD